MSQESHENFFIELLKFSLLALCIVIPIRLFIAKPFIVSGASMVPTFASGEYLIIDEISYRFEEPQRGEVVVFRYPKDTKQFFIKRIIGLPGDTVHINDSGITITRSGVTTPLDEPYVARLGNGGSQEYSVPEGSYFVMGDNRPESSDSRSWGYLPRKNIVGRPLVRLFPINVLSLFPGKITPLP